jgi:hypothetical protein
MHIISSKDNTKEQKKKKQLYICIYMNKQWDSVKGFTKFCMRKRTNLDKEENKGTGSFFN